MNIVVEKYKDESIYDPQTDPGDAVVAIFNINTILVRQQL